MLLITIIFIVALLIILKNKNKKIGIPKNNDELKTALLRLVIKSTNQRVHKFK